MKKIILAILIFALAAIAVYADGTAVVYFSATGNTERVAETIAEETGADLFEIVPSEPYSTADLRWTDDESRVSLEENHDSVLDIKTRPEIANTIDLSDYDTVFLGYPIWWGHAPSILLTFLDNEDFSGKTIIPFCTSSSSRIGNSATDLAEYEGDGNWLDGMRFRSRVSDGDIREWLEELGY